MAYRPYYLYGEIIYQKKMELSTRYKHTGQTFIIRMKDVHSFDLIAVDAKTVGQTSIETKNFHFKHGSKSLVEGFRWFRKKTPQGYAMGLIESDKLIHTHSSVKRRSKTFIEVFSPFEYKLVQRAHVRYKERTKAENKIKNSKG